jgi:hypothetical protein
MRPPDYGPAPEHSSAISPPADSREIRLFRIRHSQIHVWIRGMNLRELIQPDPDWLDAPTPLRVVSVALTLGFNGLLNGLLGLLLGTGLGFRQSLLALLSSFALAALILGSLTPVTFFLAWNAPPPSAPGAANAHATYLVAHTALIGFAGITANLHLHRLLAVKAPTAAAATATLLDWLGGNGFLGAQFSWILRPFFGSPNLKVQFLLPDPFDGNFYESVWRALNRLSGGFALPVLCLVLSGLICFPSLYIFATLAGARVSISQLAACLAGALAGLLLLGFVPAVWIFAESTDSLGFMGALAIVAWIVAVSFSLRFLKSAVSLTGGSQRGLLVIWSAVFLLVTLQDDHLAPPHSRPVRGPAHPGEKILRPALVRDHGGVSQTGTRHGGPRLQQKLKTRGTRPCRGARCRRGWVSFRL